MLTPLDIGSGEGLSLNALVRCIAVVVGEEPVVEYLPGRALDVPVSVLGVGRAEAELGWKPEVGLAEGVGQTWAWIQALHNSRVES